MKLIKAFATFVIFMTITSRLDVAAASSSSSSSSASASEEINPPQTRKTKTTKKGTVSLIITGNDSDGNDCSSGFLWCASRQECIRPPVRCPGTVSLIITGNDGDDNGCSSSAGESWCASRQECIKLFETECPTAAPTAAPTPNDCFVPSARPVTECPGDDDEISCPDKTMCYNIRSNSCYCL